MSDLVGNPEDRFSRDEAHLLLLLGILMGAALMLAGHGLEPLILQPFC